MNGRSYNLAVLGVIAALAVSAGNASMLGSESPSPVGTMAPGGRLATIVPSIVDIQTTRLTRSGVTSRTTHSLPASPMPDNLDAAAHSLPDPSPAAVTQLPPPTLTPLPRSPTPVPFPLLNQHTVTMPDGAPTLYACAPTAAGMVLAYWHALNPANRVLTPQELVNLNVAQGEYKQVGGISITYVEDEIRAVGYKARDYLNSNPDQLKQALKQGPIIAVVKVGLATTGDNHSVVITGISNSQIFLADPWDGRMHAYSWDQFRESWGANFGSGTTRNNFTTIIPG